MKTSKLKLNISKVRLIQFLFISIIALVFGYVYLVNMITFNIAQKGKVVDQISIISSEIGDLELAIIEKKKSLNRELAYEIGLTQEIENNTIFVLRGKNTRLTFND